MTPQGLNQRRMREQGRCVTCCQPHSSVRARCALCQRRANLCRSLRRIKAIAAGRCQECFAGFLGDTKFTRCLACRVAIAARSRRRRRLDNGYRIDQAGTVERANALQPPDSGESEPLKEARPMPEAERKFTPIRRESQSIQLPMLRHGRA